MIMRLIRRGDGDNDDNRGPVWLVLIWIDERVRDVAGVGGTEIQLGHFVGFAAIRERTG